MLYIILSGIAQTNLDGFFLVFGILSVLYLTGFGIANWYQRNPDRVAIFLEQHGLDKVIIWLREHTFRM